MFEGIELLTIKQACEMLQVSDQTLLKLRKRGIIKSVYPYGEPAQVGPGKVMVRIPRSEIEKFLQETR